MLTARWFPGAKLNYAEHLLRGESEQVVLVALDECGRRREMSRADLRKQVSELAAGLRRLGVKKGDRVAALLPNCAEAVIALLACASIGAIYSSCSPDFGVAGVVARFQQIKPVLMIVCDGYHYAGKAHNCINRVRDILSGPNKC